MVFMLKDVPVFSALIPV